MDNREIVYLLTIYHCNTVHICGAFKTPKAAEDRREQYRKFYHDSKWEIIPQFIESDGEVPFEESAKKLEKLRNKLNISESKKILANMLNEYNEDEYTGFTRRLFFDADEAKAIENILNYLED